MLGDGRVAAPLRRPLRRPRIVGPASVAVAAGGSPHPARADPPVTASTPAP